MRTGAPIIPVGIRGTDLIQPPDARFPKPFRRCEFRFGRPISPERFVAKADTARQYRAFTDEVMFEIRELSGQDYVHAYGGESKPTVAPRHHIERSHQSCGGRTRVAEHALEVQPQQRCRVDRHTVHTHFDV